MTVVEVTPGPCGLTATIRAAANGDGRVQLTVDSLCPGVRKLVDRVASVDPLTECGRPGSATIWQESLQCLRHGDCAVPVALLRAVLTEAGLALPADVEIRVRQEETAPQEPTHPAGAGGAPAGGGAAAP